MLLPRVNSIHKNKPRAQIVRPRLFVCYGNIFRDNKSLVRAYPAVNLNKFALIKNKIRHYLR